MDRTPIDSLGVRCLRTKVHECASDSTDESECVEPDSGIPSRVFK